MATVKSVNLSFAPAATNTQRTATVNYTFNFTRADVGKTFRVDIKLWADDTGEDPHTIMRWQPLYTFHFGLLLFMQKDYFEVKPTAEGDLSGTKQAVVATDLLNEDPGFITLPGFNGPIKLAQPDEVYATVSLLPVGPEQSARSATQTILL